MPEGQEAAPPPPDETPAVSAEPTPPAPPPEEARPAWTWEDRVGLAAVGIILLGILLPWYEGHAYLRPVRDALVAGLVAVLALAVFVLRRAADATLVRRRVALGLGLLALVLVLWVATTYYLFHAARDPKAGILGHALYLGPGLYLTFVGSLLLAWSGLRTTRPPPTRPAPDADAEARLRPLMRYGIPLLLFVAAYATYDHDVEQPSIIDFDEAHYVRVALNMTDGVLIDPSWGEPRPFNFEHPPVGKYLISLGYALAGEPHDDLDWVQYKDLCDTDNPECAKDAASWRWGSVLVGSLGVVGMYWIGLRLGRSVAAGLFAAAFLLLDNMYYLHSRIALLDIYAAGLSLLAIGILLGPSRKHQWIGGAVYGLAVAGKHTALFVLPVVLILIFLRAPRQDAPGRLAHAMLAGIVVPFLVYVATYLPYMAIWTRMDDPLYALQMFQYVHTESVKWTYGADVDPHPYISEPWTWLLMSRPVFYFVGYDAQNDVGHIYAIGNPFVWWLGAAAFVYTLYMAVHGWIAQRPRIGLQAAWQWLNRPWTPTIHDGRTLAALLFASAYAPFFLLQRDPFNFYFLIACPFLALLLGLYMGSLWDQGPATRPLALAVLLAAAAVFAFFHPVVAGTYIKEADFQYIMHRIPRMRQ